jgi:hypothetical protein
MKIEIITHPKLDGDIVTLSSDSAEKENFYVDFNGAIRLNGINKRIRESIGNEREIFNIDTERLEKIASDTPIIFDPSCSATGLVCLVNIKGERSYDADEKKHIVLIRNKGDMSTYLHELLHVYHNFWQDKDSEIEMMTQVLMSRFPDVAVNLKASSVLSMIGAMKKQGLGLDSTRLEQMRRDYKGSEFEGFLGKVKNEKISSQELSKHTLMNYYFYEELTGALISMRGDKISSTS